ncbi:radical SAM protein [Helicobacter kayseriensis]|uniref:radical SAM protein n=1 Tax=Helicobacter kayseriensis TaxID=2905877 RepID=UPI001E5F8CE2|nr:radical SAM protein [Helicobacter kayseriensis]MCE3046479.1 radical SAM protein [Helicobacter kayseriensis]MCE3048218.1 radical SAM protein [Helicobacter kayseriensis]
MQKIVFGPIFSRRFGLSLGVDLSPALKQCNFDCLYCELGRAKTSQKMQEIVSLEDVLYEIQQGLKQHPQIDVLSITANGEPTLYPFLLELSCALGELVGNQCKTLILSNGSRFGDQKVKEALKHFDIVKFSLDCVSEKCFKKLDRPHKNLFIDEVLLGIEEFAKEFDGELVAEVLVLKDINDSLEEMMKIAEFLRKIGVSRVDLGSVDRPPAYKVEGVDQSVLEQLCGAFNGLYVSIPQRKEVHSLPVKKLKHKEELLEILARRPIAENELPMLFSKESFVYIEELLHEERISIKTVANMKFFALKS